MVAAPSVGGGVATALVGEGERVEGDALHSGPMRGPQFVLRDAVAHGLRLNSMDSGDGVERVRDLAREDDGSLHLGERLHRLGNGLGEGGGEGSEGRGSEGLGLHAGSFGCEARGEFPLPTPTIYHPVSR